MLRKYIAIGLVCLFCIAVGRVVYDSNSEYTNSFLKARNEYLELFKRHEYQIIEDKLTRASTREKRACIDAICHLELSDAGFSVIAMLAKDDNEQVRWLLIESLEEFSSSNSLHAATILTKDKDVEIAGVAQEYLKERLELPQE